MRIVILTQYFPPETGAPQRRLGGLATQLAAKGHRVEVVTAMPNYPAGEVFAEWRGRLTARGTDDGVDVLRSWISTSAGRGTVGQLATYLSFAATAAATAPLRLGRADVVVWESPPIFLAPVASVLRRRLRARMVMNVSDLWPRVAVELGMLHDPRLVTALERWERAAYRAADLVTHQTEGIGAGIEARAPGTPTMLFPNGVDAEVFQRTPPSAELRRRLGVDDDRLIVGYAGNFGRSQALEKVVDAAALLEAAGERVAVVLVGDGTRRPQVEAHARTLGLRHLHLCPSQPAAAMPALLSQFDIAIVPLADAPVFDGARPSKLFELLAVGVPVVYCGRGEGATLAQESGGAVIVAPADPPALAGAVRRWIADGADARAAAGRRGRAFVAERFDRGRIADSVEQRLGELVAAQPPATRWRTTSSAALPSP